MKKISCGDFYRIEDELLSHHRRLWRRHRRFKKRFVPYAARSAIGCQDFAMNRLYGGNSQMP